MAEEQNVEEKNELETKREIERLRAELAEQQESELRLFEKR